MMSRPIRLGRLILFGGKEARAALLPEISEKEGSNDERTANFVS